MAPVENFARRFIPWVLSGLFWTLFGVVLVASGLVTAFWSGIVHSSWEAKVLLGAGIAALAFAVYLRRKSFAGLVRNLGRPQPQAPMYAGHDIVEMVGAAQGNVVQVTLGPRGEAPPSAAPLVPLSPDELLKVAEQMEGLSGELNIWLGKRERSRIALLGVLDRNDPVENAFLLTHDDETARGFVGNWAARVSAVYAEAASHGWADKQLGDGVQGLEWPHGSAVPNYRTVQVRFGMLAIMMRARAAELQPGNPDAQEG